jgi:TatD DNase family protein
VADWVDTHCHLFLLDEDPATAIDNAVAGGVSWMVCPGIDLESTLQARAIALQHPDRVRWSAGLHPHSATEWEEQRGRLSALALEADAIGECGLDYYRDLSPRQAQRTAFADQVDLAVRLGKPIIVHVRDAFSDAYDILGAADLGERAVMHCWTGGPRWTKRFDDLGVTFSFAGPVTYDTADAVRRGAAVAPRDRTLVETDSPYLAPEPHRGENNRPEWSILNGEALAELWGVSPATVAEQSSAHASRLFGGPAS